ncbi:TetR/AcrR family transcriptional regulator [Sporosarcina pasteurii]|uniref:Transcriptional regulator BetI n=1 Tax=Sporosarcina pasteurii TaxID=1474 RepID=A0A380BJ94_SPOPA|nr:TetR/AcrR family transcriptional regulator [Sporosarcina pasteurii]MDS9470690.1 TetR/AcrR family transcriptional regulator [Sporosarcina pasteurii]QBQ05626.1 TetR/AcrR family transcriptional regulator [Sporosarcina pasteurii]SUJ01566.1 transcriptional regulator BetI [Sporosarcina pasteurii]
MTNRAIQKSRMWKYFIEATKEIIEQEGIHHVTIRKVADRAGYNSATIYNYFKELSHLVFFASLKMLKSYVDDVTTYMARGQNSYEKYMLAWECMCKHSFEKPELFHAVFIQDLGNQPHKLIEEYYSIYPAELINVPTELKSILFERNITKRGLSLLDNAAEEGHIKREDVEEINEMTILIWQGMLSNMLNNRTEYDSQVAASRTMHYIEKTVHSALKNKLPS